MLWVDGGVVLLPCVELRVDEDLVVGKCESLEESDVLKLLDFRRSSLKKTIPASMTASTGANK